MKKPWRSRFWLGLLCLALALPLLAAGQRQRATRPLNVLLIIADDLNNDLGCYGHRVVRTPNIDRLAAHGVRFDRAYCQYPVCNPSRVSFLSGRRPGTTRIVDNVTPTRAFLKDAVFLPQHFRQRGYRTMKVGKIFHTGDEFEDPVSWDADIRETDEAKSPPASQLLKSPNRHGVVLNARDEETWDGKVARKSIELLEQAARAGQPFFLATGFRRPHTPYIAPQKYFALYPLEQIPVRTEPVEHLRDVPQVALTYGPDERKKSGDEWRHIIQAYYASISFMDAQVGVLLDALDRGRLWESTVVIFMSDHGYHLGEHGGMWHKMSLFEESARVPLIVAAPGYRSGTASARLMELVDLYPTLTELCGLPSPAELEGTSFVPLLEDPKRPWKPAAFTEVSRGGALTATVKLDPAKMGYAVRTARWRYIEWFDGSAQLYDHDRDPFEYRNLAGDPKHAQTVAEMKRLLRAQTNAAHATRR